jgi:hypothetical protein
MNNIHFKTTRIYGNLECFLYILNMTILLGYIFNRNICTKDSNLNTITGHISTSFPLAFSSPVTFRWVNGTASSLVPFINKKQTTNSESASELYLPSDRRLSAK